VNLVLCAVEPPLADAWERFCGDLPFVSVHRGSIFDVACDAVVSPANSFGFMDGGIDLLYSRFFGWEIETRVQDAIKARHHGELLVGAAEIVETAHEAIPFLIAAPTMRVPMILRDTVNPFLAARAVLLLVKYGVFPDGEKADMPIANTVKTIAFPGLGTASGGSGRTCVRIRCEKRYRPYGKRALCFRRPGRRRKTATSPCKTCRRAICNIRRAGMFHPPVEAFGLRSLRERGLLSESSVAAVRKAFGIVSCSRRERKPKASTGGWNIPASLLCLTK
jgi:O-acetyl-ADP-ribose deacetylase (regulator of RNase III)